MAMWNYTFRPPILRALLLLLALAVVLIQLIFFDTNIIYSYDKIVDTIVKESTKPFDNTGPPISSYNLSNVLTSLDAFRSQLNQFVYLFIYHPPTDEFIVVEGKESSNGPTRNRIRIIAPVIARALRLNFPKRFPSQHEFAMVIGTTDWLEFSCKGEIKAKAAKGKDVDNCKGAFAPVMQFGSVYKNNTTSMPVIAMPMHDEQHLPCYDIWQYNVFVEKRKQVCDQLQIDIKNATGDWEKLRNQIVWRGTDYHFLENYDFPDFQKDIKPRIANFIGDSATIIAISVLSKRGDRLLPRWKGVLLTSQAELKERLKTNGIRGHGNESSLPWINIKFAGNRVKARIPNHRKFQEIGITTIGEYISDHSPYKYHIDLGGGGGTTFTGTISKLAMV